MTPIIESDGAGGTQGFALAGPAGSVALQAAAGGRVVTQRTNFEAAEVLGVVEGAGRAGEALCEGAAGEARRLAFEAEEHWGGDVRVEGGWTAG
jgi:hypothetical protein